MFIILPIKIVVTSAHISSIENNIVRRIWYRKRKILWYTPPFNQMVVTKLVQKFLHLIVKNFLRNKPLSKILNRSTLKLSNSCIDNLEKNMQNNNAI